MRKQLAFITALMALTLGVGIFAGARQSTDSHGVDVALEEARQHVNAGFAGKTACHSPLSGDGSG